MWNYRLVKHQIDNSIGIYEIFYHDDGTSIRGRSKMRIVGNDLEDLKGELINMQKAFDKPILVLDGNGDIKEDK
jgi:hypothetical protein